MEATEELIVDFMRKQPGHSVLIMHSGAVEGLTSSRFLGVPKYCLDTVTILLENLFFKNKPTNNLIQTEFKLKTVLI